MLDERLAPSVACGMGFMPGPVGEIAAYIARRDAKRAGHRAEDMRIVLTHAAAPLQCLGAGGVDMGLTLPVLHRVPNGEHDLVQRLDGVPFTFRFESGGKIADGSRAEGVGCLAEIEPQGKL